MRFRPLTLLFLLALSVPILAGCEVEGGGDDLSSGSVNDTGEVPPEADPLPEGWDAADGCCEWSVRDGLEALRK